MIYNFQYVNSVAPRVCARHVRVPRRSVISCECHCMPPADALEASGAVMTTMFGGAGTVTSDRPLTRNRGKKQRVFRVGPRRLASLPAHGADLFGSRGGLGARDAPETRAEG